MNEAISNLCKQLRLAHVAEAIEEVPFTKPKEYIYQILLKELAGREQAKIARNLKQARFINTKTLESYQWHKDICLPGHLSKEHPHAEIPTRLKNVGAKVYENSKTLQYHSKS